MQDVRARARGGVVVDPCMPRTDTDDAYASRPQLQLANDDDGRGLLVLAN
jgi:hypothetical protein